MYKIRLFVKYSRIVFRIMSTSFWEIAWPAYELCQANCSKGPPRPAGGCPPSCGPICWPSPPSIGSLDIPTHTRISFSQTLYIIRSRIAHPVAVFDTRQAVMFESVKFESQIQAFVFILCPRKRADQRRRDGNKKSSGFAPAPHSFGVILDCRSTPKKYDFFFLQPLPSPQI